jgi:polyhydroxybutyrate depolymerase
MRLSAILTIAAACSAIANAIPSYVWLGGSRDVQLQIPTNYDPSKPTPVLFLLHGYLESPKYIEDYFKLAPLADAHGYLYLVPSGLLDINNDKFFNGTEACCDFYGPPVDDAAYIM